MFSREYGVFLSEPGWILPTQIPPMKFGKVQVWHEERLNSYFEGGRIVTVLIAFQNLGMLRPIKNWNRSMIFSLKRLEDP